MSCECYRIGGPFIAEDPDCPEHGYDAQKRRAENEDLKARIETLETQMASCLKQLGLK